MRSYSCPTCRAPVWQVLRDPEYASVIGAEITSSMAASSADIVSAPGGRGLRTVQVPGPAGITIGTTISSDSSGAHRRCAVTKVVRGDGAYRAGIRAGDVILSVNGTQVHDHAIAVECIGERLHLRRASSCSWHQPAVVAGQCDLMGRCVLFRRRATLSHRRLSS